MILYYALVLQESTSMFVSSLRWTSAQVLIKSGKVECLGRGQSAQWQKKK